jgi:hypothetical protein
VRAADRRESLLRRLRGGRTVDALPAALTSLFVLVVIALLDTHVVRQETMPAYGWALMLVACGALYSSAPTCPAPPAVATTGRPSPRTNAEPTSALKAARAPSASRPRSMTFVCRS